MPISRFSMLRIGLDRQVCITPQQVLDAGWLEMTIPDKPRSSKQRYRATAAGMKALEEAEK